MKPALQRADVETISAAPIRHAASRQWYAVAALILICGFAFFFGLGRLSLIGPDEPRFAEAGREMFATGDYVTPRVAGETAFDKPALLYWAMAASYHLFGVSEFAARFPSALAALLCVLFLYHAIASTISARIAFIASVTLATSLLFMGLARAAITDMLFTAAVSVAMLCAYLYETKASRARLVYRIAGGAATGLAVLAKGLIGIVLIAAILAISYAISRRPQAKWRDLIIALAICFVVAAAWYTPVTIVNGYAFIDEFIIKHHFRRFLTNRYSHPQPVWFYLPITLAGALPWTFYLIPAVARLPRIKPRSGDDKDYLLALAWVWLAVPLVFFSISQSKLPSYILPASPALAIIIGAEVERMWNGERDRLLQAATWLTAIALVSITVAVMFYLNRESLISNAWEWMVYSAPIAIALATLAAIVVKKPQLTVTGAAAVILSLIISITTVILPRLDERFGLKRLSLEVASALRPDEKMAFYQNKNYAPIFYAEGRAVSDIARGEGLNAYLLEEIISSLETEPSLIVITTSKYESDLTNNPMFNTEPIAKQGEHCALRVQLAREAVVSVATQ
ncbi:MAG TPA: glycosyltransferase family 39 protein [Blastocatellia bacterium]|nr:glycosyltransferase family 39 protein [Blastocatellia bacterium]